MATPDQGSPQSVDFEAIADPLVASLQSQSEAIITTSRENQEVLDEQRVNLCKVWDTLANVSPSMCALLINKSGAVFTLPMIRKLLWFCKRRRDQLRTPVTRVTMLEVFPDFVDREKHMIETAWRAVLTEPFVRDSVQSLDLCELHQRGLKLDSRSDFLASIVAKLPALNNLTIQLASSWRASAPSLSLMDLLPLSSLRRLTALTFSDVKNIFDAATFTAAFGHLTNLKSIVFSADDDRRKMTVGDLFQLMPSLTKTLTRLSLAELSPEMLGGLSTLKSLAHLTLWKVGSTVDLSIVASHVKDLTALTYLGLQEPGDKGFLKALTPRASVLEGLKELEFYFETFDEENLTVIFNCDQLTKLTMGWDDNNQCATVKDCIPSTAFLKTGFARIAPTLRELEFDAPFVHSFEFLSALASLTSLKLFRSWEYDVDEDLLQALHCTQLPHGLRALFVSLVPLHPLSIHALSSLTSLTRLTIAHALGGLNDEALTASGIQKQWHIGLSPLRKLRDLAIGMEIYKVGPEEEFDPALFCDTFRNITRLTSLRLGLLFKAPSGKFEVDMLPVLGRMERLVTCDIYCPLLATHEKIRRELQGHPSLGFFSFSISSSAPKLQLEPEQLDAFASVPFLSLIEITRNNKIQKYVKIGGVFGLKPKDSAVGVLEDRFEESEEEDSFAEGSDSDDEEIDSDLEASDDEEEGSGAEGEDEEEEEEE